jgi:hypothetical protein
MSWRAAIVVAICGLFKGIGVAGRTVGLCPNVPSGMLNAVNKMSRAAPAASDDQAKKADAMRLTPTHLFHNSTDVVRAKRRPGCIAAALPGCNFTRRLWSSPPADFCRVLTRRRECVCTRRPICPVAVRCVLRAELGAVPRQPRPAQLLQVHPDGVGLRQP